MNHGLELSIGDKFLVGPGDKRRIKFVYTGHWLRIEQIRPPEEEKHIPKPARYLVEWHKEDNPGLYLDPTQFHPHSFYWIDEDWATYIKGQPSTQKPRTAILPDI